MRNLERRSRFNSIFKWTRRYCSVPNNLIAACDEGMLNEIVS